MKIMVCYDGSSEALAACRLAATYASKLAGGVTVVTSVRKPDEVAGAQQELARARSILNEAAVPCQTEVLARDLYAGEDLVLYAQEKKVDLLVLGVKNRSKVGKLLLGSVTQHVMLQATCPVMGAK